MRKHLGYLFILAVVIGLSAFILLRSGGHSVSSPILETDVLDVLAGDVVPQETSNSLPQESASLNRVERIIDGDTFVAQVGGKEERIRLIGIDTPELHPLQPYAEEAKTKLAELLGGGWVRLKLDVRERDKYGRILAYVYAPQGEGEIFVNYELVRQGYAKVMTIPPDVAYADEFVEAQRQARQEALGLWSLEE